MSLQTGNTAPDFRLVDDGGAERALSDYEGRRLVIYFYPRAFTPGCTTQACDFRDNYSAFQKAGYEIVGVSTDQPQKLADFRVEHDLPFTLLSDPDHSVAERYGAWGLKKLYGKEVEGLIRSTIVVDGEGVVTDAWYNVRAKGHGDRMVKELT